MKVIDNITQTVRGDLAETIHKGSKLSIAAACFSIYAYQELKKQLDGVEESMAKKKTDIRIRFSPPSI